MNARVFLDAFSEVVASVAMGRKYAARDLWRAQTIRVVTARHGDRHAEATGRMFDRLWSDLQSGARQ